MTAQGGAIEWAATTEYLGTQLSFAVPPALAVQFPATADTIGATWQPPASYDRITLAVASSPSPNVHQQLLLEATKHWLDANTPAQVSVEYPPDFDPTWMFQSHAPIDAYFDLYARDDRGVTYDTWAGHEYNGGQ